MILSGLKATGGSITPARVRRALEHTCIPLGGSSPDAVLTYGRGLMQVDKAFEFLVTSATVDQPDRRWVALYSECGGKGAVRFLRERVCLSLEWRSSTI